MPSFQGLVGSNVCAPYRAAPDIGAIADLLTGVAVSVGGLYTPYYYQVGGTSLATPVLAGLVADMDAARVAFGKTKLTYSTFNGEIYPAAAYNYTYYFFDITSGYNGYYAGPQFDLLTGPACRMARRLPTASSVFTKIVTPEEQQCCGS